MLAGRATLIWLGQDSHGSRIRMPSQLTCPPFEQNAGRLDRERRQRIGLGAGRVKGISSTHAGDSQFPLRLCVVGFQIGIGNWPIGETGSGDGSPPAVLLTQRTPRTTESKRPQRPPRRPPATCSPTNTPPPHSTKPHTTQRPPPPPLTRPPAPSLPPPPPTPSLPAPPPSLTPTTG